jgi:glycosyltransferase involved in cell wall biosynthesis
VCQHDIGTVVVAFDGGPLLGPRTGVGAAVAEMASALGSRPDVELRSYALSMRGTLLPDMVRLPLPAAVAQRLWARTGRPRLDRWMRPAQVVHGTNYAVGPSRLPRVVSVYDCWFLRNPDDASPVVRRVGQVLRRAVGSGAVVHASSHATADAVRELLGTERVEVIPLAPLPAETDAVESIAPIAELDGAPFILAIGTLERRKNIPMLVTAFGPIAEAHPDVRLVLAGATDDDRAAIDAAVDALPIALSARVLRTGRVDAAVKQWLLAHTTVLAYPSLDEGFGFPLLEAMQHRIPVVASNRGSIPEVAADAAVLVEPLDADALAGALEAALTDTALRDRLVRAGEDRLRAFSWEDTGQRLADLYRRLATEDA